MGTTLFITLMGMLVCIVAIVTLKPGSLLRNLVFLSGIGILVIAGIIGVQAILSHRIKLPEGPRLSNADILHSFV